MLETINWNSVMILAGAALALFFPDLWRVLKRFWPSSPSLPTRQQAAMVEPTDCTLGELICCLEEQAEWDSFKVLMRVADRHLKEEESEQE